MRRWAYFGVRLAADAVGRTCGGNLVAIESSVNGGHGGAR